MESQRSYQNKEGYERARNISVPPKPHLIKESILDNGIKEEDIVLLKEWGEYLSKGSDKEKMSTSQIRKFFGEIKRIQADFEHSKQDVILLDPKIAYAVGRAKQLAGSRDANVKIADFYQVISPLLKAIKADEKHYKIFVQICEAIVAYHKEAGGKE
jgi:CRISPR-associated protein Csm2